jgi:hypothetical protein
MSMKSLRILGAVASPPSHGDRDDWDDDWHHKKRRRRSRSRDRDRDCDW